MTTSFAYSHNPPVMSSQHYEGPYPNEAFSDFLTGNHSYSSAPYSEPFTSSLTAYGTLQTAGGYPNGSRTQDSSFYGLNGPELANGGIEYRAESPDHLAPPHLSTASESGASVQSAASSGLTSPRLTPQYQHLDNWQTLIGLPVSNDHDAFYSQAENETSKGGFIDPIATMTGFTQPPPMPFNYPDLTAVTTSSFLDTPVMASAHSPAMSAHSPARLSPYHQPQSYHSYAYTSPSARRLSTSSSLSRHSSHPSNDSYDIDNISSEQHQCPLVDCGRTFKDLKAHMLTHQPQRPEKCPIPSCEYHTKGFARKYDKNRHTLTHYKGTMVCGFCPGTGSSSEKSFNRADVFKRHLTSVHQVEQTPPNSRRKSPHALSSKKAPTGEPDQSGKCSTCSAMFANPQVFYEHLDDCVLRVVQLEDPAEAINQKHLSAVKEDNDVKDTLEKHHLPTTDDYAMGDSMDEDEEDEADESADNDDVADGSYGSRNPRAGKGSIKTKSTGGAGTFWQSSSRVSKSTKPRSGLTFSKGGVRPNALTTGGGRKKRKDYPPSWGCTSEKMTMRKRVLCVYDGPRRLLKDDMMLNNKYELRVAYPSGDNDPDDTPLNPSAVAYVTDLDVQTLRRADGAFNSTEAERGPWVPDNILAIDPIESLIP